MTIPRNLSNLAPGTSTGGVLSASYGGTGLTSPGASGNVLTSNGTTWTSATASKPILVVNATNASYSLGIY